MSKEARALLKKINDKKNAIKSLVNEGKTKEAKEAKAYALLRAIKGAQWT